MNNNLNYNCILRNNRMLKPIVKRDLAINTSYPKYIQQQLEDQNNILQVRQ